MNFEEWLKRSLEQEGPSGDPSSRRWEEILSNVRMHKQDRAANPFRFLVAMPPRVLAITLVVAIGVGGIYLLATAPWDTKSELQPWLPIPSLATSTPEVSTTPEPTFLVYSTWTIDRSIYVQGDTILALANITLRHVWETPVEIRKIRKELRRMDAPETKGVQVLGNLELPSTIQSTQDLVLMIEVGSDITASIRPGTYFIHVELSYSFPMAPPGSDPQIVLNSPPIEISTP